MSALEGLSAPLPRPIVLVVEDEILIRLALAEMLRDCGIDVVEAGNADEAADILGSRSDISLVFTDVRMPGSMDGFTLARWIAERHPAIRTILTSGEVGSAQVPAEFDWRASFVPKPYRLDDVTKRLQGLLAG